MLHKKPLTWHGNAQFLQFKRMQPCTGCPELEMFLTITHWQLCPLPSFTVESIRSPQNTLNKILTKGFGKFFFNFINGTEFSNTTRFLRYIGIKVRIFFTPQCQWYLGVSTVIKKRNRREILYLQNLEPLHKNCLAHDQWVQFN